MRHTFKRIALIGHDNKKPDLAQWALFNREFLADHELVATGTTGMVLEEKLGLEVVRVRSGPLGGDQQIGAMIAEGRVDLLVLFADPLQPMPHDPDVKALLRLAVVWNIPVACSSIGGLHRVVQLDVGDLPAVPAIVRSEGRDSGALRPAESNGAHATSLGPDSCTASDGEDWLPSTNAFSHKTDGVVPVPDLMHVSAWSTSTAHWAWKSIPVCSTSRSRSSWGWAAVTSSAAVPRRRSPGPAKSQAPVGGPRR